jgi:hypothetical protein
MSNYPVSDAVMTQLVARFSDPEQGWNATYNELAPNYANVPAAMAIDFAGLANGRSVNFIKANIAPDDWIDTTAYQFPLLGLYIASSRNENLQKFHQFSGTVVAGVSMFLSWDNARLIIDFHSIPSCVEETIYTIFNRARISNPGDQDWNNLLPDNDPGDVVFNGDVQVIRHPLRRGDGMWAMAVTASAEFQVDQKGQWA